MAEDARSALVLGAGMVGTATALHLQQRGWDVALIDANAPGSATSHGNAGLVQGEAVEPYPFPRDLSYLFTHGLLRRGAAIDWHAGALLCIAPKLLAYYRHSHPTSHARLTLAYAALIQQATREHQVWMEAVGAGEWVQREGFRCVFRSTAAWDQAAEHAQRLQQAHGVNSRAEDARQLAQAEPALRAGLAGAIHWQDAWAVRDPGGLVQAYAKHFVRQGGALHKARMMQMRPQGRGWRVHTDQGPFDAAHLVLALGPWSDQALAPLGYPSTLLIKRGYHMHYQPLQALRQPLLDAERGYVLAPMRQGLRLTTGAEFAALDAPPTPRQLPKAERCARELLDFGPALDTAPWLGARPCTVDMLPLVGAAPRHRGLWVHFGHGHQGFTLGPVTGRLLAEIMSRETPFTDPVPYSPQRCWA